MFINSILSLSRVAMTDGRAYIGQQHYFPSTIDVQLQP